MARKPPLFAVYSWAGSVIGEDGLRKILEAACRAHLAMPWSRAALARVLGRVLGRAPSRDELTRHAAALGARMADFLASVYTLDALPREERAARLEADEAVRTLEALRRRGRGVILASAHFGNLPLTLAALAARGLPLTVTFVNGAPYKWCEDAFGFKVSTLGTSAVDCWTALQAGEIVVAYCDQDFFPDNRTADFFGAPVRPPHGVARLAAASGAPVLPAYAVFQDGRHRLEAQAPIEPDLPPERLEEALLRSMERAIRARPDHWLMLGDPWDVAGTDAANRRHLKRLRRFGGLFGA